MIENFRDLISTIKDLLLNIISRIDDISNKYVSDNTLEDDRILNLLDDINALSEGIAVIGQYFESLDLSELREKLSIMVESFERKDYSLLIDSIQYELKPLLAYWNDIIANDKD